jgi:hypothetical protein
MKNDFELKEGTIWSIVYSLIILLPPIILFDQQTDFQEEQVRHSVGINILISILIVLFVSSLKFSRKLHHICTILLLFWFCLLPVLFYSVYQQKPFSFAYNKEYLMSNKISNSFEINLKDNNFLNVKSDFSKEINVSVFKNVLPRDSDTLILLKNYIVFSPYTIYLGNHTPPTYIKVYDKVTGKFLFQMKKKTNLLDSYNYFNKEINFKINKVKTPEIGITYFNFWCSSIIGFKDNLIIPLKNWITLLNTIFISIIFIPIFNYIKAKFFDQSPINEKK